MLSSLPRRFAYSLLTLRFSPPIHSARKYAMSTVANPYTEAWLAGPQSTQFYTRTYSPPSSPPKAALVFVHGFAEHIARYTHFHPLLAQRGVAVFAFDLRGFGLTAQDTEGHKSKTSAYGKTCWKDQMADIEWAVGHAKKTWEGVPLFLGGHSMGGGQVLGFATQGEKSPYYSTATSLAGIIATSPLIEQTKPAPKLLRWIGGKISVVSPYTLIPADVNGNDLSHDPAVAEAYFKDPLVKQSGSLRGIADMLTQGEALIKTQAANWPKNLPLLIVHGTDDKVSSHKASETFIAKAPAANKKISLYTGSYHEIQNEPEFKDKLLDELVSWIEETLTSKTAEPAVVEAASTPGESEHKAKM